MPKLSIIVPVYNVEKYIYKCIDSLLAQTFEDYELILVDDGSPDNCGKICDEYALANKKIKVIHKKNGGVSAARNTGVLQAEGEYVAFVDPDDWVDKAIYTKSIQFMEENDLDIVCFDVTEVRTNKTFVRYKFDSNKVFSAEDALQKILVDVIDNSPCNKVYKKDTWENVHFPVGRRFEDVATIYKTFYNSKKVGYIQKAYYYYLKREGSAIALSFDAQRRFENFLGYKERYEFSKTYCKAAEEKCKMFAVKTALSAITAENAGSGKMKPADKSMLMDFLQNIGKIKYLNGKNKLLLWGAKNCPVINTIYGKLSMWSKKLK